VAPFAPAFRASAAGGRRGSGQRRFFTQRILTATNLRVKSPRVEQSGLR